MKTQMSVLCLITVTTLSACNSNSSNPISASSQMIRASGNERCLDMEAMSQALSALPDDHAVRDQVTNIEVVSGSNSHEFELEAVRSFYEAKTLPKIKQDDGSKTVQTGCETVDTTYKNGRVDHYKITQFTENSLTIEIQDSSQMAITIHRIDNETAEETFDTDFSICDGAANGAKGIVRISETTSWASPLPEVAVSPVLLSDVQEVMETPAIACGVPNNSL